MILKGYEDSASGSEDESGGVTITHRKSKKPIAPPLRSSYLIKPIERSSAKESRHNNSSDEETMEVSGSDEDLEGFMSETPRRRKITNNKNNTVKQNKRPKKKNGKPVTKHNNILDDYSFNTVFIVDYDMTLVDKNAHPFPGAKRFIRDLHRFNGGRATLVLYSHASSGHIERGLSTHFAQEADLFTETITDHTMSKNKPVTQVRRVLSDIKDLSGPFVIIDDARSNLDDDQYDITIDVSRHFIRDKTTNQVMDIDYDTIWCLLNEGIKNWLLTKKKKMSNE